MALSVQQTKTIVENKSEDPEAWDVFVPRTDFKAKYFVESASINGVNIQPHSMVLIIGETPVSIPADIFNVFFTAK